jgi:hypothetical protein
MTCGRYRLSRTRGGGRAWSALKPVADRRIASNSVAKFEGRSVVLRHNPETGTGPGQYRLGALHETTLCQALTDKR